MEVIDQKLSEFDQKKVKNEVLTENEHFKYLTKNIRNPVGKLKKLTKTGQKSKKLNKLKQVLVFDKKGQKLGQLKYIEQKYPNLTKKSQKCLSIDRK